MVAVIGSYSSLQGLLIWVAGLIVLLWRHPARAFFVTWIAASVATTVVYFLNFNFSGSGNSNYLLAHPLTVAEFFLVDVGDVGAQEIFKGRPSPVPELVTLGVVVVLLAITCLVLNARPGHLASSPIGPALICFGLLFAVTVAYGRAQGGLSAATQSRYATFNLLILVGCYLCLVERFPSRIAFRRRIVVPDVSAQSVGHIWQTVRGEWKQIAFIGLRALALILIVFEVASGAENGISGGADDRTLLQQDDLVAAHVRDAPDSLLQKYLVPGGNPSPRFENSMSLRRRTTLSFFATAEAERLARE